MNTSFFYHVSVACAIDRGYNFEEGDIYKWSEGKSYLLEDVWSNYLGEAILAGDLLQASQGLVNDKLYRVFKHFLSRLPKDICTESVVLTCSHSGIYENLTVQDIHNIVSYKENL